MIDAAAIMLFVDGRMPGMRRDRVARDAMLIGYRFVVPRGYDFEVSPLGQARHLDPLCVDRLRDRHGERRRLARLALLGGVALALVAAVQYVVKARREVGRP